MLEKSKQQTFHQTIKQRISQKYGVVSQWNNAGFWEKQSINQIVAESISSNYIRYKDYLCYDDVQELLKREYSIKQIGKKIETLTEYYKFHRNLPFWNYRPVQRIMNKYYNKVKDVDYKRIKSILKRQQNISLTTQKSFSSFNDSQQITKKSHYSSVLSQLQNSTDTVFLRDMCANIKFEAGQIKHQEHFRGSYCSGQDKFEQFLKNQKKMKTTTEGQHPKRGQKLKVIKLNSKKREQQKIATNKKINKLNFQQKNLTKSIQLFQKSSKQLQKDESVKKHHKISIVRKSQVFNSHTDRKSTSNRKTLTKNVSPKKLNGENLVRRNSMKDELIKFKYMPKDTMSFGKTLMRYNKQTFQQGQGANWKLKNQKSLCALKSRSNSTHSYKSSSTSKNYENILRRQSSSKQKVLQSAQRGSIPLSTLKGSTIQLAQLKSHTNRPNPSHQQLSKHSKNNSNINFSTKDTTISKKGFQLQKQNSSGLDQHKHEKTRSSYGLKEIKDFWNTDQNLGKKRNSIAENLLEKKIQVFKKKLAL